MHAMRAIAVFRTVSFVGSCVFAQAACDVAPGSDSERMALSASALERAALASSGENSGAAASSHAAFVAGTLDARLELGGRRLLMDSCDSDDPACVPNQGSQQLFVASLDRQGRARWLVAPLRSAEESHLYDTEVREDAVFVLASYRGPLALHQEIPAPATDEVGLILLELDLQGSLIRARKLGNAQGYSAAQLSLEPGSGLRVEVTFQGSLSLPEKNVAAGSGRSRATLHVDTDSSKVLVGQVEDLPHAPACLAGAALCNAITSPLSGCDAQQICIKDPFCCNYAWDALCVTQASERLLDCPCTHALGTIGLRLPRGCDAPLDLDNDCPSLVCDGDIQDPYCCNTYWDGICVNNAAGLPGCD